VEKAVEIFALVSGVIYVILEIRQKNFMWVLGILTSLASMWMFYSKGAYASFILNVYYFVTAFIGLWQWRQDKTVVDDGIHIRRMNVKTAVAGLLSAGVLTFALSRGMDHLHACGILKENPMSLLDASIASLSAVATWWLVRSYLEQWWLWIASNLLSIVLCAMFGMWWMMLLYVAYVVSSVIGLRYWKKHGVFVSDN
jgi:nicotinamide mononucleotide transporter